MLSDVLFLIVYREYFSITFDYTFRYFLEISQVWKKPKYNSLGKKIKKEKIWKTRFKINVLFLIYLYIIYIYIYICIYIYNIYIYILHIYIYIVYIIYMVFITEGFFEVAIESWPEWDLSRRPLNSVQTL